MSPSIFQVFYLLLACGNFVTSSFVIPKVTIKAFEPQGLKISIPFTSDDQSVAFHGNINKQISRSDLGEINGDDTEKVRRKWVLRFPDVKLKVGDKIYYWVFVQHGYLGYISMQEEEIKELHSGGNATVELNQRTHSRRCKSPEFGTICERVVVNLTQNLLELQDEVESLNEKVTVLTNLVQRDPKLSKTLQLDGLIAGDDSLTGIVQAIVKDKLHLPFTVENVKRVENGKIEFEVENLDQKLQTVKAAKTKLEHSRYVITS